MCSARKLSEIYNENRFSFSQGRTKAIHVYEVGEFFNLVDMPGYGENTPQWYDECVNGYLKHRKKYVATSICCVILLLYITFPVLLFQSCSVFPLAGLESRRFELRR